MFGMVLFWAVLITAVVLAIRYLSAADRAPGRTLPPPGHTPEDLLAQRFARARSTRTNTGSGWPSCSSIADIASTENTDCTSRFRRNIE